MLRSVREERFKGCAGKGASVFQLSLAEDGSAGEQMKTEYGADLCAVFRNSAALKPDRLANSIA